MNTTRLHRQLGATGAVIVGLGSILGSGVFVSIGLGAEIAGPWVLLAIALAAGVALCNGLSSAQLAARHPVSGGTYEYGYRLLHPLAGFSAGWLFLLAKSASAATAALGAAGYLAVMLGFDHPWAERAIALAMVLVLTLLVLAGLRRSTVVNALLLSATVTALIVFIIAVLGRTGVAPGEAWAEQAQPFWSAGSADDAPGQTNAAPAFLQSLFHATALMFVAYTGYGRIATMGEEIKSPRSTIPRAILITLAVSLLLYVAVAYAAIQGVGAERFAEMTRLQAAPLEQVALAVQQPIAAKVAAAGAVAALLGVLLNLLLGLSRVVLAMGRRADLPSVFAGLSGKGAPTAAIIVVALVIGGIVLLGDVGLTWTLSAFAVLLYYAATNLAALRLEAEARLYPRAFAIVGLAACAGLAAFVPLWAAGVGLGALVIGLLLRAVFRRIGRPAELNDDASD